VDNGRRLAVSLSGERGSPTVATKEQQIAIANRAAQLEALNSAWETEDAFAAFTVEGFDADLQMILQKDRELVQQS
jgi:hypothetical protein